MIVVLISAATLSAMLAAVVALFIGQPWWVALAIYVATGVLTVLALGLGRMVCSLRHKAAAQPFRRI